MPSPPTATEPSPSEFRFLPSETQQFKEEDLHNATIHTIRRHHVRLLSVHSESLLAARKRHPP